MALNGKSSQFMDYVTLGPTADHVTWCPKLIASNYVENKSVSALNIADTVDNIYIYLYTAWAVSTTGGII